MTDERLRGAEREVAREATAAGRLQLARELERLGRTDEAVDALFACRDDRLARVELARLRPPATGRWSDVRPVRTPPRRRWSVAGPSGIVRGPGLTPTPGALAVDVVDQPARGLDLLTGARLYEIAGERPFESRSLYAVRDTLLVLDQDRETGAIRMAGHDAWSGVDLWETTFTEGVDPDSSGRVMRSALFLPVPGRVVRHALDAADARPGTCTAWDLPFPTEPRVVGFQGDRLLVLQRTGAPRRASAIVALDEQGGVESLDAFQGSIGHARADDHGLVVLSTSARGGPAIAAHDAESGRARWTRRLRRSITLECHSPRWLVLRTGHGDAAPPGRYELVVLSRSSGDEVLRLRVSGGRSYLARDVLLAETPTDLRAVDLDTREVLWTLPDAPPCSPVPVDGAVLFLSGSGAVECWGA